MNTANGTEVQILIIDGKLGQLYLRLLKDLFGNLQTMGRHDANSRLRSSRRWMSALIFAGARTASTHVNLIFQHSMPTSQITSDIPLGKRHH
jgi:hypothetical protein